MQSKQVQRLESIVRAALTQPTFAAFADSLKAAGVTEIQVANCGPRFALPEGIVRISEITREFWLRFCDWEDGFGPWLRTRPGGLGTLWRGLTGSTLRKCSQRLVAKVAATSGAEWVAKTMCQIIEQNAASPVDRQYRLFADVCQVRMRQDRRDARRREQMAAAAQAAAPLASADQAPQVAQDTQAVAVVTTNTVIPEYAQAMYLGHPAPAAMIAEALKRPLFTCCSSVLLEQGYQVGYCEGVAAITRAAIPVPIPLAWFGLDREFGLRICEWPDRLPVQDWSAPVATLGGLWRMLFGAPPDAEDQEVIRRALRDLPAMGVAHAMYVTCCRAPDAQPCHRRGYVCCVCRTELKQRIYAQRPWRRWSPKPQPAPAPVAEAAVH